MRWIRIRNLPTGRPRLRVEVPRLVDRIEGLGAASDPVAVSPDGRLLAWAGSGGRVRIQSVTTGRELHWLDRTAAHLRSVAFSPDGRLLAAIGDDDRLRLWDQAAFSPLPIPRNHKRHHPRPRFQGARPKIPALRVCERIRFNLRFENLHMYSICNLSRDRRLGRHNRRNNTGFCANTHYVFVQRKPQFLKPLRF